METSWLFIVGKVRVRGKIEVSEAQFAVIELDGVERQEAVATLYGKDEPIMFELKKGPVDLLLYVRLKKKYPFDHETVAEVIVPMKDINDPTGITEWFEHDGLYYRKISKDWGEIWVIDDESRFKHVAVHVAIKNPSGEGTGILAFSCRFDGKVTAPISSVPMPATGTAFKVEGCRSVASSFPLPKENSHFGMRYVSHLHMKNIMHVTKEDGKNFYGKVKIIQEGYKVAATKLENLNVEGNGGEIYFRWPDEVENLSLIFCVRQTIFILPDKKVGEVTVPFNDLNESAECGNSFKKMNYKMKENPSGYLTFSYKLEKVASERPSSVTYVGNNEVGLFAPPNPHHQPPPVHRSINKRYLLISLAVGVVPDVISMLLN